LAKGVEMRGRGAGVAVEGAAVGAGGVEGDEDDTSPEERGGQREAEDQ
jgi:hypothetical protein